MQNFEKTRQYTCTALRYLLGQFILRHSCSLGHRLNVYQYIQAVLESNPSHLKTFHRLGQTVNPQLSPNNDKFVPELFPAAIGGIAVPKSLDRQERFT